MARNGPRLGRLHAINPALILCSIAPFGQTGPYRDFEADDTRLDRALRDALRQRLSRTRAGASARIAGLSFVRRITPRSQRCARCWRAIATGEGQWIDLSIQEATASAVEHVAGSYFGTDRIERRHGTLHWSRYFGSAQCRDGYVMHCTLGDWTSLVEWVSGRRQGAGPGRSRMGGRLIAREHAEHLFDVLDEWVKDYSRDELLERAQTSAPALRHGAQSRRSVRR